MKYIIFSCRRKLGLFINDGQFCTTYFIPIQSMIQQSLKTKGKKIPLACATKTFPNPSYFMWELFSSCRQKTCSVQPHVNIRQTDNYAAQRSWTVDLRPLLVPCWMTPICFGTHCTGCAWGPQEGNCLFVKRLLSKLAARQKSALQFGCVSWNSANYRPK